MCACNTDEPIFLEISVDSTLEQELTELELLEQVSHGFKELYGKDCRTIEYNGKSCVRIDFPSQQAFAKIYEKSYSMYVYIFEQFVQENLSIENLFERSSNDEEPKGFSNDEEPEGNYMVLRYRSNCMEPMRQYYEFAAKVNKFFGAVVINEQINDGYLRFIGTKTDYEILLLPSDMISAWQETFKIRGVSLNHPLIVKFFASIEKWKKEVWEKRKIDL
ncbi:MAG: hypothetical protein ACTSYI_08625 [Promethearchaeota archaeon]